MYDKDSLAQLRLAWESVRLPAGTLTLGRWMEFQREFQLKRDRVEDRTAQEEYRLLLSNLPTSWQREVLKEESKKRENKWVVRLTNMPVK